MKKIFFNILFVSFLFSSNDAVSQYIINGDTMICFNKQESKKIAVMLENMEYLNKENRLLKEEISSCDELFELCETNMDSTRKILYEMSNEIDRDKKKIDKKNKIIMVLYSTNLVSLSILTLLILL